MVYGSPSSVPAHFSWADFAGIHDLAAPIVLDVFYAALFAYYLVRMIREPSIVWIMLLVFCVMRIVAFTLRAVLAGSDSAAQSLNLFIVYTVFYSAGFLGLVFATYMTVMDRASLGRNRLPQFFSSTIWLNKLAVHVLLFGAVILAVVGSVRQGFASTASGQEVGHHLYIASFGVFMGIVALLFLETLFIAFYVTGPSDAAAPSSPPSSALVDGKTDVEAAPAAETPRKGDETCPAWVFGLLLVIELLIILREAFFVATATNLDANFDEHLFYPLAALPEALATLLFVVPGLIKVIPFLDDIE